MKTKLLLVSCAVFLSVAAIAREPAATIPLKDSTDAPVNKSPSETGLRLAIVTPKGELRKGVECEFTVAIQNPSATAEIVYMPALKVKPDFLPAQKNLRPEAPVILGRAAAKDERLNYVILLGGDSYARTFHWTPPDTGQVFFRALYTNTKNGWEIGVKAWTGELRAQSEALEIATPGKSN